MKSQLHKIFSAILVTIYISWVALPGAAYAVPAPQAENETTPTANQELERGYNPETGKVSFIRGETPIQMQGIGALTATTPQDRAMNFLAIYGKEFGLQNPSQELEHLKSETDENSNDVVHYQQVHHGVPVIAAELIVNMNANGELLSISGEVSSNLTLNTTPVIEAQDAYQTALGETAKIYNLDEMELTATQPELWIFDESTLAASTRPVELVWRIEVTAKDSLQPIREMVLVNAQTGEITFHINQVHNEATETSTSFQIVGPTIQYTDLIVDEARGKVYGADKTGNKIDVIDIVDLTVTDSYLLVSGALPTSIDLSPDGNELAVAQSGLNRVRFINLTDGSMSDTSSMLSGSNTKATDVIYGRPGVLYALSNNGLHVINTSVFPHAEDGAQFVPDNSSSYSEGFGAITFDKNTLYYVTGTCCSGDNSLYKFDISSALAKPVLSNYTYLSGSGSRTNIRLSLIDDDTLITSFGTLYDTTTLVPIAKNGLGMAPALALPGRDFYVTSYNNTSGPDVLYLLDNQNSYKISSQTTSVSGIPGALAVTNDGATLFVSSTGGMTKFDLGTTPPGTPLPLPASLKQYRDFEFDMPRNVVYGTDSSNRIDVIDQNTGEILNSYLLPNGANPIGVDLSPDGSELAIALNGLEKLLFIHPETGATIAEVTPQLSKDIYYTNVPYDVIYGRSGRLYSDGNPGSGDTDFIHVFDAATHTWLARSSWSVRTGAELAITADGRYLYANETFSPHNIEVFDVQTDVITLLYQAPTTLISASRFAITPDGNKVFTAGGQVWTGDLQEQLGTLEGGAGKLIKFVPGRNIIALTANGTDGDVVRFLSPVNFRLLSTYDPIGSGTFTEMEAAPDGSKLFLNSNNAIQILSLDPALPMSMTVQSGSGQSVQVTTPFQDPLKIKVQNLYGNPLPNVTVSFQAPSSGASASFTDINSNTTSVSTDTSGIATTSTLSANTSAGSYAIQATVPNLNSVVSFQMTNLAAVNCTLAYGTGSASLFQPYTQYRCNKSANAVASGDFNSDGRQDVALSTSDGLLLIYLQDSNGNLSSQPRVYSGNNSSVIAVGDLNHDGRDDLVIPASGVIRVFLQKSDGTFLYPVTYATGGSAGALAVGDVNNDELVDVVVNIGSNLIGVFTQRQNGTLNPIVTYPSLNSVEIAIGDVNGDDLNDVVSLNSQSTNQLQIFIQSNGTLNAYFSKSLSGCSSSCSGRGIGIGDVTNDGRGDIVMSYGGNRPSSNVAVFAQAANGDLQPSISYTSYDIPVPVEITDVNSDSLSDIVLLHSSWQKAGVYLQSNGGLSAESLYTLPSTSGYSPLGLNIRDVNADGFPDVLIADGQGLAVLYRNAVIPPTPTPYVSPTPGPGPSPTPRSTATAGPSPTTVPPSSTGSRKTYTAGGGSTLPGTFLCNQAQSSCTSGADPDADEAHQYAADTFVFYNTHHGRNSIDNAGGTITSTVNYGIDYENAFWNHSQVVYGDNMAADDVVGHEITHGVTEYTSGLIYYGQSGAINESFSDVWGEFIDQTNGSGNDDLAVKWLVGEDSVLGVIRSMSNPPAYGNPDKMSSPYFYTGDDDNGGVHINSGVNNKAAYLMVEGGAFNGRKIIGIGLDKTAAIYYETQVNHLTMGANYNDLYYALIQACQNLVGGPDGITHDDCEQVRIAAESVEMILSPSTPPTGTVLPPTWWPSTATGTPTNTPTTTFTPSRTRTPISFPTGTVTPTRTATPPLTGTSTPTATSTVTATFTSTTTPTVTKIPVETNTSSTSFTDVPDNYWASSFIQRLYNAGITGGCGNNNYCPGDVVTRAQMAIFLLRGIHGSSYAPPAVGDSTGFEDVQPGYWAAAWIKQLAAEGITSGCGSGKYCPEAPVTRAEMAIFLLRSKYGTSYRPPGVSGGTGFADVEPAYWAAAWVKQLVAEGITAGCGNGNYCPGSPVTRAQMAVFLVRAFNLP